MIFQRVNSNGSKKADRPGAVLILLILALGLLLAMVGLVIDAGMLMAVHRHGQNAADAAALEAAFQLYMGNSNSNAIDAGKKFAAKYLNIPETYVTINIPPVNGPHAGLPQYAEAIISFPSPTYFMTIFGITGQTVSTRACAGYENVSSGEGAIVLNPYARPGLSVQGGATLQVDGTVIVNSQFAGWDQYGTWVDDWSDKQYALTTSNNSKVKARVMQVHGGVDVPANYLNFDPDGPNPLFCRAPIAPDPLWDLPIPTPQTAGSAFNSTWRGAVTAQTGDDKTFYPGIYEDIVILGSAKVTFMPGIYVLNPTKPNQGLRINGSPKVVGDGIMFYATGSNYYEVDKQGNLLHPLGEWDIKDPINNIESPAVIPPAPLDPNFKKVIFSTIDINITGGSVFLDGLHDANSAFDDMLFFQRRRAGMEIGQNTPAVAIQGKAGTDVTLGGTVYTRTGHFHIEGEGKYDAQFVVGSMDIAGQALVVLNATGKQLGKLNQVFLVE